MTNFKTSFKFFSVLFISILLTACSNDDGQSNEMLLKNGSTSELWMASDYEYIGEEHNRNLAVYFAAILESDDLTKDFAISVFSDEANKYDTTQEDKDLAFERIEFVINSEYSEISSLYHFLEQEELNYLSLNVKSYLDDLNEILDTSVNLNETLDSIRYLETVIENNIEILNKERMILFSATNTAKSSLSYWNENGLDWYNFKNEEPQPEPMGFWGAIRDVGKADVAGAIGGAVTAAIVNAWPCAGQVAYGAAIVGAGAGASATAAVLHFW